MIIQSSGGWSSSKQSKAACYNSLWEDQKQVSYMIWIFFIIFFFHFLFQRIRLKVVGNVNEYFDDMIKIRKRRRKKIKTLRRHCVQHQPFNTNNTETKGTTTKKKEKKIRSINLIRYTMFVTLVVICCDRQHIQHHLIVGIIEIMTICLSISH